MKLGRLIVNGEPFDNNKTYNSLSGAPYISSSALTIDYEDISSIQNWDFYGIFTNKDYKYIRKEIQTLYYAKGWDNLTFEEMKVICKHMASGFGVEYHNGETIWTDVEQFQFQCEFRQGMQISRTLRDSVVADMMTKMVFLGYATQASAEDMIKEISVLRGIHLRDGVDGVGYGDNTTGLFNYLDNTDIFTPVTIVDVNSTGKTFTVSGNTASKFVDYFRVRESTANDGKYYISAVTFDGVNTVITTIENVPDSTVDGIVYHSGFMRRQCASAERRDFFLDIYVNGNY